MEQNKQHFNIWKYLPTLKRGQVVDYSRYYLGYYTYAYNYTY